MLTEIFLIILNNMPQTKEEKIMMLDEKVSAKLAKLSREYPNFCAEYLIKMHRIIDLAEEELSKIK